MKNSQKKDSAIKSKSKKVAIKKTYKNEKDSEGSDIASDDSMPELEEFEGGVTDRKKNKNKKKEKPKEKKLMLSEIQGQETKKKMKIMKEVVLTPNYMDWRLSKEDHELKNKTQILYQKFREIKDEDRAARHEKQ